MVLLTAVGDVDDLVGFSVFDVMEEGCEVGGGVVAGAVFFTNDEGVVCGFFTWFGVEDDEGALAFLGDIGFEEFFVDAVDFVAVEGFAVDGVELDVHNVVDFLEGGVGDAVDFFPELDVIVVALLEFYEFCSGAFFVFVGGFE